MNISGKAAITSEDVARLAQVSQSSVSRAFTPGASISEKNRQKVLDAARRLGYRPNAHARSLITGRSKIIGLVLLYLENPFYAIALQRLAERLQRDGYHVLLFINHTQNADGLVSEILQYAVDGIVLAATSLSSVLAAQCADAGIPVVLFNRVMADPQYGIVSSVRTDNVAGGRVVADYLAKTGHRRIAYLAGNEETSTNLERERGFREGLQEHGLRIWGRAVGNYSFEQACQATREIVQLGGELPDAIFVANDHMAFAAMDTMRHELGLSVPEDISVVGFDNVPQASWGSYRLTTVEQPMDPMIEATVGILQKTLGEDGVAVAEEVLFSGQLIVRESAMDRHAAPQPMLGKQALED